MALWLVQGIQHGDIAEMNVAETRSNRGQSCGQFFPISARMGRIQRDGEIVLIDKVEEKRQLVKARAACHSGGVVSSPIQ